MMKPHISTQKSVNSWPGAILYTCRLPDGRTLAVDSDHNLSVVLGVFAEMIAQEVVTATVFG